MTSLIAENVILKKQLAILKRQYKRCPQLSASDRIMLGWLTAWIKTKRLAQIAVIIKPITLLKFHKALVKRKYRLLFSNKNPKKPGPKEPSHEIIQLVLVMKKHNPQFGYRRIAMQIVNDFWGSIDNRCRSTYPLLTIINPLKIMGLLG